MSMELLTFLQLIYVIALYLGVVVLIPAAVFHGKFEDHPFYVRYTAYTCIGNFYLMNLVFLLQLFKISNRVTLILGVVLPALIGIAAFHWQEWVKASLISAGETTHNVLVSTMGFRLFFSRIFQNLWQAIATMVKAIAENMSNRWFDWIGTLAIIALVCWQYGTNLFNVFGYTASDMLVHNQWINAMNENNIFVSGVYPFGFHCILYFFHAVFGVETYVLLRLYSLLMTFLLHLVLLFFLRLICKSESTAYIATGLYLLLNIWGKNAYTRFFSALPQEYGMIFILPSLFFLILFLREREDEEGEKGLRGKKSTTMLWLFGMNVSMTLAVHFYDTIALGIFCVAIALAFCRVIFRKAVLGRILAAGTIGIVVAILPMWFAYLGGTPLEGSLRWGVSVMEGRVDDENEAVLQELNQSKADPALMGQPEDALRLLTKPVMGTAMAETSVLQPKVAPRSVILTKSSNLLKIMSTYVSGYVFISPKSSFGVIVMILILVGLGLSVFTILQSDKEVGRVLLASCLNLLFFCLLLISKELGVPVLMDKNRCATYFAYFFIVMLGLVIDVLLSFCMGLFESETMQKVFPAVFAVVCFVFLGLGGWVRKPAEVEAFQKNGAIICVTNILRENEPYTFNIISANDELRMTEEYGYHYEAKSLLTANMHFTMNTYFTVPSRRVYVFIEKIPGVYDEPYEGGGQPVSAESASKPLPLIDGLTAYKGENRHIIMSKLYFWAKKFAQTYENEMSVYYEDAEFVCYEIRQNVDRPFDLSFEYGYND